MESARNAMSKNQKLDRRWDHRIDGITTYSNLHSTNRQKMREHGIKKNSKNQLDWASLQQETLSSELTKQR